VIFGKDREITVNKEKMNENRSLNVKFGVVRGKKKKNSKISKLTKKKNRGND